MLRVLLVEDDVDLSTNFAEFLEREGYTLDFAYDGRQGLALASAHEYDVILLDLGLPHLDGVEVIQRLRHAANNTPILAITARDSIQDKGAAFASGVDDYLVKPFELRELVLRMEALNRRGRLTLDARTLTLGPLVLEADTGRCKRDGVQIDLTRSQTLILQRLILASPTLVTREQLSHELWAGEPPSADALRMHVFELRSLIDKPFEQQLIETVHGRGYYLNIPQ